MNRLIAEWIWRAALIGMLAWIGWELHDIREELMQPADEQAIANSEPSSDLQDSVDDLSDSVAALNDKVDALMIATMQLKR